MNGTYLTDARIKDYFIRYYKRLKIKVDLSFLLYYNINMKGGNDVERKSKYLYSKPDSKGLVMTFEYRGRQYDVIRSFIYPTTESTQHREEQQHIDMAIEREEYAKAHPQDTDSGKIPQEFWDMIRIK